MSYWPFLIFFSFFCFSTIQAGSVKNKQTGTIYKGPAALQRAIDHAAHHETLLLKGTFKENITFHTPLNLTLKGLKSAVIDGDLLGSTLTLLVPADLTLQNITILNGKTEGNGGGISGAPGTQLFLQNVTICNNSCHGMGGGIYIDGGSLLVLDHSTIENNTSSIGGGVYFFGSELKISYSNICGNSACFTSDSSAGGIYVGGTTYDHGSIEYTHIKDNLSRGIGAGIEVYDAILNISHTKIKRNASLGDSGGGIACSGWVTLDLTACKIESNRCSKNGGGIFAYGCETFVSVHLLQSTIKNNRAFSGGGIYNVCGSIFYLTDTTVLNNYPDDIKN